MKLYRIAAPFLLLALPLAACGGGGDDDNDTTTGDNDDISAELTALSGGGSGSSSDNKAVSARIAALDLCPMLTDAEANDVANKAGLGGTGTTKTFIVTREKGEYTSEQQSIRTRASCRFLIEAPASGLAVIQVEVTEADDYESLFKPGGTPIADLGDDAVNTRGTVYVKVGDLIMTTGENSATSSFATEIFRKIAPDLK